MLDAVCTEIKDGLFSGLSDSTVIEGLTETSDANVLNLCGEILGKLFCICLSNEAGAPLVTILFKVPVAAGLLASAEVALHVLLAAVAVVAAATELRLESRKLEAGQNVLRPVLRGGRSGCGSGHCRCWASLETSPWHPLPLHACSTFGWIGLSRRVR